MTAPRPRHPHGRSRKIRGCWPAAGDHGVRGPVAADRTDHDDGGGPGTVNRASTQSRPDHQHARRKKVVMQIGKGLHRVGSDIVNSYLIADQDGVTIIDAGLPGYWKPVQAELAAMGKSLSDVRALILTHGDTDHIGFAARLYRETGVAAHIHEADADRARLKVKQPHWGWGPVKIGPLAGFLWYSARRGGPPPRPATPPQSIAPGDALHAPPSPPILP